MILYRSHTKGRSSSLRVISVEASPLRNARTRGYYFPFAFSSKEGLTKE
jgi:hypothetical protein